MMEFPIDEFSVNELTQDNKLAEYIAMNLKAVPDSEKNGIKKMVIPVWDYVSGIDDEIECLDLNLEWVIDDMYPSRDIWVCWETDDDGQITDWWITGDNC